MPTRWHLFPPEVDHPRKYAVRRWPVQQVVVLTFEILVQERQVVGVDRANRFSHSWVSRRRTIPPPGNIAMHGAADLKPDSVAGGLFVQGGGARIATIDGERGSDEILLKERNRILKIGIGHDGGFAPVIYATEVCCHATTQLKLWPSAPTASMTRTCSFSDSSPCITPGTNFPDEPVLSSLHASDRISVLSASADIPLDSLESDPEGC